MSRDLCPNCLKRPIDEKSEAGFCGHCTAERRADKLAGERRWWRVNGKATRGYLDLATASIDQLEGLIQTGLATFVDVGLALEGIRDRRLYKERGFSSFEAYTLARWGFGRRHAYYQIRAAEFVRTLTAGDDESVNSSSQKRVPIHEVHVRELMRLDDDEARECWEEILAFYPPEAVTLDVVRQEVERRIVSVDLPPELPPHVRLEKLRRKADVLALELVEGLPWDPEVGEVVKRLVEAGTRYLSVAP